MKRVKSRKNVAAVKGNGDQGRERAQRDSQTAPKKCLSDKSRKHARAPFCFVSFWKHNRFASNHHYSAPLPFFHTPVASFRISFSQRGDCACEWIKTSEIMQRSKRRCVLLRGRWPSYSQKTVQPYISCHILYSPKVQPNVQRSDAHKRLGTVRYNILNN